MDIRYVAGFIDGEGSLSLSGNSRSGINCVPELTVVNTRRDVLVGLRAKFGGGNILAPKRAHPAHRIAYRWSLRGWPLFRLLRRLAPYLIVKRRHAALILSLEPTYRDRDIPWPEILRARARAVRTMHRLNQRGTAVAKGRAVENEAIHARPRRRRGLHRGT